MNSQDCPEKLSITPLRIANILLDGRFAGPQNRVLQVAERLKKYGIETVVLIPKNDSEIFHSKLLERNIIVQRLNLHRITKHWPHLMGYILFFLPELFSIYNYLKRENIKLVHCNCPWQIKGVIAGKMARAKVIWHLQDTRMPRIIRILFNVLTRFLCDGFIVAGNRVKHYYLGRKKPTSRKIMEIQAPVDTLHFNPKSVLQDNAIANNSGITITTVGNITPAKGIEYFIEMASMLDIQYENLHFYVVGPPLDSQKHYSRQLARILNQYKLKNVHFYGNCDNVPGILKGTDIYVCSSVTEASPMSVWEAMAMQKAIVSTNVGDVRRFIRDGKSGFIVPPADSSQLAQKVSILIDDCNLRKKFGKFARATAVKELDIGICVDKHRNFYAQYLDMKQ
jgi:glycosyltransferase involved in cell wall biosynthesis